MKVPKKRKRKTRKTWTFLTSSPTLDGINFGSYITHITHMNLARKQVCRASLHITHGSPARKQVCQASLHRTHGNLARSSTYGNHAPIHITHIIHLTHTSSSPAIDWFGNTEPYYQIMSSKKVASSQLSSPLHSNKQTDKISSSPGGLLTGHSFLGTNKHPGSVILSLCSGTETVQAIICTPTSG